MFALMMSEDRNSMTNRRQEIIQALHDLPGWCYYLALKNLIVIPIQLLVKPYRLCDCNFMLTAHAVLIIAVYKASFIYAFL